MTTTARGAEATSAAPTGGALGAGRRRRLVRGFLSAAPIFVVLVLLLIAIGLVNPRGFDVGFYLAMLKRAAPLMVLAAGQLFVIVSGEFDLSVGSIVTVVVVAAAVLTAGDPAATYWVIALLFAFGVTVGLVNGLITTRLRVP